MGLLRGDGGTSSKSLVFRRNVENDGRLTVLTRGDAGVAGQGPVQPIDVPQLFGWIRRIQDKKGAGAGARFT